VSISRRTSRPASSAVEGADGLLRPELTEQVRGGLYEVHSTLGPGFIQRVYVNAVRHELGLRGLEVAPRRVYEVFYRGRSMGEVRFRHLEVEGAALVFPVAVEDVRLVGLRNLKVWMGVQRIPLGLVANFHPTRLGVVMLRGWD
jgi:GxxExxY protein